MPIWILQNQYANKVLSDLRKICPDPGLSVDAAGRVNYVQTQSGVGEDTIALLGTLGSVGIRGETSSWSPGKNPLDPNPAQPLGKIAGVALFDRYPGTRIVDIAYDATECAGNGFVTVDPRGVLIALPGDVLLFHEIAHAVQMFQGIYNPSNREPPAIVAENFYRASRGMPTRGSWIGGCAGSFTPSPGVGSPARRSVAPAVCGPLVVYPQAIGTDHTYSRSGLSPGDATYIVNINNQTSDLFTEIVLFVQKVGVAGVTYLSERDVPPGIIASFSCGRCGDLVSYVVGFFIGQDLVAKIPQTGNMTPALASLLNPTDVDSCADSWMITD